MKTSLRLLVFLALLYFPIGVAAQGPGNALQYHGQNGYVVSSNSNRNVSSHITVSAWVNTSSNKYMWVVGKYDRYGAERGYHLIIKDGKAAFAGRDGSGYYRNSGYSSVNVNDGNWHHLTGVCDGSNWEIYIDGVLQNSFSSGYNHTSLVNSAPLAIGKDMLADNEFFVGQIDEVRIWNTALNVNEVRDQMCTKFNRMPDALVAHFNFDQQQSSTVTDLSPLRLHGQLQNLNPNTSWVKSGAPIGDESIHMYTKDWEGLYPLQVEDTVGRLSVDGWIGEHPEGLQMYLVKADTNDSNGHAVTDRAAYFGFFTPLAPKTQAKLRYLPLTSCKAEIDERLQYNSAEWKPLALTEQSPYYLSTSESYRGEYKVEVANGTLMIEGIPYICPNGSTTLTARTNGSVLWSTGETSKTITVTEAGTYTATVVIAGCTLTESVIVETASLPTVDLGPDLTICEGQKKTLSAPVGFTYRWSTGATSRTIEVSASGTYWVEATNSQGCSIRDAVNLTVLPMPTISLPAQIFACPNSTVLLDATTPGASYLWSNGQNTPTVLVTAPAELSVAVTVNGCTFMRTVSVLEINTNPVSIQSSGDFCVGSSTTLSISTDGSVLWNTGETSKSISVSQPGEYSVTVTQDGCSYTDQITVREIAYPLVDLGPNITICSGEQTVVEAPTGDYTYKWSTGETSQSIEVRSTGAYWVEVTNSNGCTSRDEIHVTVNQQPAINIPAEISACYGERVTIDATTPSATYFWSTGQTSARINVTAPTKLSVDITVDGCIYTFPVTVSSDECPIIPNIITPNGDGKNDSFVLQGINLDAVSIEIFNRWGQSVYKRDAYDNSWAGAASGMYYYHIKSSLTQKVYKGWLEVVL